MSRRNKHVRILVALDQAAAVNEIMLRNGYGPGYLTVQCENHGRVTHMAVETLADSPEYAAIRLSLENVLPARKTVEVEHVTGRQRPPRKLDELLTSKRLKRRSVKRVAARVIGRT